MAITCWTAWWCSPAVGDRLTVSPADRLSLSVTGPFAAGLAAEADNLVLRAARALAARGRGPGHRPPGAGKEPAGRLRDRRRVGGRGGGAAAAVPVLGSATRRGCGALAARPGRRCAGVSGRACRRGCRESARSWRRHRRCRTCGIVLVNPGVAVSTPAVFRARAGGFLRPGAFAGDGLARRRVAGRRAARHPQ